MIVTIKAIKVKEGDNDKGHWYNTQIDGDDGSKWTSFVEGLRFVNVGDTIEIDKYESASDPKHRNKILSWHPYQETEKESPLTQTAIDMGGKKVATEYRGDPRQESIEIQSARKDAVSWCAAVLQSGKEVSTQDVLKIAKIFYDWKP